MRIRISKAALYRRWIWSTALGIAVFAVLTALDYQLRTRAGVSAGDLHGLNSAIQYQAAFQAWAPEPLAARAGFALGLAYLFMPLYAASFFYSGVVAAEGLMRPTGQGRGLLLLAAMIPVLGAVCDAAGNTVEFYMLANGPTDGLAMIAHALANARIVGQVAGLVLLAGAVAARFKQRRQKPKSQAENAVL